MDIATFAIEAEVEENHWWFVGRRWLFAREVAKLNIAPDGAVLDVGTSTGTNLRMLQELGYRNVTGLDFSETAIRYCAEKGLGDVRQGDICQMPFADGSFELVLATDIIEHVDDDHTAVHEIARVLKPGQRALITVPTFPSLWGLQDIKAQHKRRYRMHGLLDVLKQNGLVPERRYYFNFLLFVPIWIARQIISAFSIKMESENELNSPLINCILQAIFSVDIAIAPIIRPPFGVSALVIAKKADV